MYTAQHAAGRPDQPAIIMAASGARLTFAEFDANANRLAQLFRGRGFRRGDHIAILMENNIRYREVMAAAERTGLYYTCVNSFLTPHEAAYVVGNCDVRAFVTSSAKADVATQAAVLEPDPEAPGEVAGPGARSPGWRPSPIPAVLARYR